MTGRACCVCQLRSSEGRGRLFVREAIQHRLLVNTLDLLADQQQLLTVVVDLREGRVY